MTQVSGGYYCNGLTEATGADLSGNAVAPYDLQTAGGSAPQTLAVPIGLQPAATAITAQADGTKANATVLDYGISGITVVAGAADSVLLPPAIAGRVCILINKVATAIQVFGQGTDTINAVATGTGVSQAASKADLYVCDVDGEWWQVISG